MLVAAANVASAKNDLAGESAEAGAKIDFLTDNQNIEAGDTLFNKRCSGYCHGRKATKGRSPSLRNRHDMTVPELHRIITKGRKRAGKVMPSWGRRLKEDQIWQLVAYIVSLRDAGPVEK